MPNRPLIYHGTPITPDAAFRSVMPGRAAFVSYHRPDQVKIVEQTCPFVAYDNGAFSHWKAAQKRGQEWSSEAKDWTGFFKWLEPRLFYPGRWAVIPDVPGAPSQLNDPLLEQWPFGQRGAPLWHMDPDLPNIPRLLQLCGRFDRVCIGWTGRGKSVDCPAFHRVMEDVSKALGNRWPVIHMMRGVKVAQDYPFASADSTSLGQNGNKYDKGLQLSDGFEGMRMYAEKLEAGRFRFRGSKFMHPADHGRKSQENGPTCHRSPFQLGLL